MSVRSEESEEVLAQEADPRWLLVERIVASSSFARSERLSSFLKCVCELTQRNRAEEINEQFIGTAVFGRSPDYDPGVDSIVRSHASRLRHRLQQYFEEEGADEELILTIPKGRYVPVFERRVVPRAEVPLWVPPQEAAEPRETFQGEVLAQPGEQSGVDLTTLSARAASSRPRRRWMTAVLIGIAMVAAWVGGAWIERRHDWLTPETETHRLFWGQLFNGEQKTVVVLADSGVVMLQNLIKRRVSLATYMSGDYLKDLPKGEFTPAWLLNIGTRRYTSIVDITIQNRLFRLPGLDVDRTQFRYSRDLRLDEIKQGNLVLLGSYESTPWVQLFEPSMNFYFQNNLADGVFSILNRHPRPGEQTQYDSLAADPQHTVYGVVAYRPSLSGSGKVLILEGQSMAGTEAAADFAFDDAYLLPFLRSIRRPNGSIPYFELLLRSKSISAEASQLEIMAVRSEDDGR